MILAAVSGCADASPGEVYRLEMSTLSQQEIDCLEHGHQVSAAPRLHLAALTFASASCPHVPPELADGMYSVNAGSAASGSSGASSSSPAGSSGKFHSIRQYKRLSSSILNTPFLVLVLVHLIAAQSLARRCVAMPLPDRTRADRPRTYCDSYVQCTHCKTILSEKHCITHRLLHRKSKDGAAKATTTATTTV
jgi:hypothetical protein